MHDNIQDLLTRAAQGEDLKQLTKEFYARQQTAAAQENLENEIAEDDDITGQDNEERIDAAAADLIHARDMELKARDPESYHERRQMGLL